MSFNFDQFIRAVRAAAGRTSPSSAIREVMQEAVSDPAPLLAATPTDGEDEIRLFEDDDLSIWRCRFQPEVFMPPHEHLVEVHIAGYDGGERNILYRATEDGLEFDRTKTVQPGEVFTLDRTAIHAVTGADQKASLALHVYMGPLTRLKRSLFDWTTGEALDFTDKRFERMKIEKSQMSAQHLREIGLE